MVLDRIQIRKRRGVGGHRLSVVIHSTSVSIETDDNILENNCSTSNKDADLAKYNHLVWFWLCSAGGDQASNAENYQKLALPLVDGFFEALMRRYEGRSMSSSRTQ